MKTTKYRVEHEICILSDYLTKGHIFEIGDVLHPETALGNRKLFVNGGLFAELPYRMIERAIDLGHISKVEEEENIPKESITNNALDFLRLVLGDNYNVENNNQIDAELRDKIESFLGWDNEEQMNRIFNAYEEDVDCQKSVKEEETMFEKAKKAVTSFMEREFSGRSYPGLDKRIENQLILVGALLSKHICLRMPDFKNKRWEWSGQDFYEVNEELKYESETPEIPVIIKDIRAKIESINESLQALESVCRWKKEKES